MPDEPVSVSNVLRPGDVARLFNVSVRTVSRWARQGKLPSFRTPGHRVRFYRTDIEQMLESGVDPEAEVA